EVQQHLGNATHADAANPNKVYALNFCKHKSTSSPRMNADRTHIKPQPLRHSLRTSRILFAIFAVKKLLTAKGAKTAQSSPRKTSALIRASVLNSRHPRR